MRQRLACSTKMSRLSHHPIHCRRESYVMAATLTRRSRQILERVQEGQTPREIADELDVSRNAIYQHIGKLRKARYLPPSVETDGQVGSVDSVVGSFRETLEAQLQNIDASEESIKQELSRLLGERHRVRDILTRLASE